ncbi:T9SS type A sorting domain-containing protein [candidate division WOR-3 bacterium]|nr:T9SS type A sorting domain-containing protein [candidate division WOR-3 bacterium]
MRLSLSFILNLTVPLPLLAPMTWSEATMCAPWDPKCGHTSVVYDDKIWVMGGWFYSESTMIVLLNDVWYSTSLNEISERNPAQKGLITDLEIGTNPFRSGTIIAYNLTKPRAVQLNIYDSLGKEVAILFKDRQGSGAHKIKWNGTDAAGKTIPAGTYFLHLKTPARTVIKKIVKL